MENHYDCDSLDLVDRHARKRYERRREIEEIERKKRELLEREAVAGDKDTNEENS